MVRDRMISARKLSLLLLLLLPLGCHLTNQAGEGTLGIAGDSSWTAHDRVVVLLQDGRGTDTLFDGKLLALDTLARLPAGGYGGGQALFIIQGFRNGELAYEERRTYDGARQELVAIEIPFDRSRVTASPSLDIRPDQVRLFLGGAAASLEIHPSTLREGRALTWKTGEPGIATVSQDGVLSPVGEGTTYVQASSDSVQDASSVKVVRDIPTVNAGAPDTTVPAGTEVTFHVTVTQEYGDVAAFAWDLDDNGVFDDSVAGTAGQTRFATAARAFAAGEIEVRFRVRDSEGNHGEAAKLVKVSRSAPKIDSLEAKPLVVSIHDPVAFTALATGSGADLLAFAWDFDGDGDDEATGSLQGDRATVANAHRYPRPSTYRARLRIEDANAISVAAEVTVSVKLDRPVADAGPDRTADPGAEVRLQGRDADTLGRIVSREWKCGAAAFTPAADSGVHVFTAPSTAGTTICVFRVTDDDSLAAEDTLRIVVNEADAPSVLSFTPADTTITIRDSVTFAVSAAAGTADLKAYALDMNEDGRAELQGTLSGRTAEFRIGWRFPYAGRFNLSLTAEDQSGKSVARSARVVVIQDPPKANAGKDTTVVAGTRVNLHGTGSDSLGSVALREWKIGNAPFARISGGDTSFNAPSAPGPLVCVFRVTDDDGQAIEDIVEVTVSPSRVAALTGLGVSTGNLSPDFSAQTEAYTVSVPNATTSLTVTPASTHLGATIQVNGTAVASGSASGPVNLPTGVTVITILVTAQDTSVRKSYTVTVTRAASGNANLSALAVSTGTLDPPFSAPTANYSLSVTAATLRITPTADAAGATIQVKGATVASGTASAALDLAVGPNPIPVNVTAPDGVTTKEYTVSVTRISTDPSLLSLALPAGGAIDPGFSSGVTAYTVTATAAMSAFTVRPTVAAAGATLTVDGTAVVSGQTSGNLVFPIGPSSHSIVVTAPDGVTKRTYTLTVNRPVPQAMRYGYARVDNHLASHEVTTHVYNPAGKVDFVRDGAGRYTLHFRGLAALGGAPGIVHATAYTDGSVGAFCKVLDWTGTVDLTARINCFSMRGVATDAKVSVMAMFPRNGTLGHNAYALADQHTRTPNSPYAPDASRAHSTGGSITIIRRQAGNYQVEFAGLGGLSGGTPMITAVGSGNARCQLDTFNGNGPDMTVYVQCMGPEGASNAPDAQFNISIMQLYSGTAEGVAVMSKNGITPEGAFNNGGGAITVATTGTGVHQVTFAGLGSRGGSRPGNVQVATNYTGPVSCQAGGWTVQGTDLIATIRCFDETGALVDFMSSFLVWVLK